MKLSRLKKLKKGEHYIIVWMFHNKVRELVKFIKIESSDRIWFYFYKEEGYFKKGDFTLTAEEIIDIRLASKKNLKEFLIDEL